MNLLPGTSEEALLALVNAANPGLPQPLKPGDLYFGQVKSVAGGKVQIPAVTIYDSAYEGYAKFEYRRLNLSQAFGSVRPALRDIGYPTLHQLLPVINQRLGINLGTSDVIDTKIDWLGNNEHLNIQVTASANSLGYEGTFVITFTRVRPMLNKVVATTTLDVLKHPSEATAQSLPMYMYSIDFSGYDTELRLYYNQLWYNIQALKRLMVGYGFADWPQANAQNLVRAYLTKDRPEANQAFTNVIIQKNPAIAGWKGDAYFHYNR